MFQINKLFGSFYSDTFCSWNWFVERIIVNNIYESCCFYNIILYVLYRRLHIFVI